MKEEGEYKESEGQAEVRGSGRVAQEAGEPSQTRGKPPLKQNIGNSQKEPQKKSQEGSSSSSTGTPRDPEDEQCSADTNERKKDRNRKKSPVSRNVRKGGRVAGRPRGLARTHGKAWKRKNTKTPGTTMRRKGGYRKEPRAKAEGKAPLNQETEKPQEAAPEEHREGAVSSATVLKEGEEGEQQHIDQKNY